MIWRYGCQSVATRIWTNGWRREGRKTAEFYFSCYLNQIFLDDSEEHASLTIIVFPQCLLHPLISLRTAGLLPAVTFITLAISLSIFYGDLIEMIVTGFSQSLRLMNFAKNNLDFRGLLNMRKAADIVWLSIDLKKTWLAYGLTNLPNKECSIATPIANNPCLLTAVQVIQCLAHVKKCMLWILKMIVCQSTLDIGLQWLWQETAFTESARLSLNIIYVITTVELLEWMERTLADILWMHVLQIFLLNHFEYVSGIVAESKRRVRNAVYIVCTAQNLQDVLRWYCLQESDDENANIDSWCSGEANLFISNNSMKCKVCSPPEETNPVLEKGQDWYE